MRRAPLPRGRELQVAFLLAKAKAACHAIVEMSRDGNTMLLAHRWFRCKGWRRLTRIELAALRTAIRRSHKTRVEDVGCFPPATMALRLELSLVSGTTVFAEHLERHAVMTEQYALPAIPENRVMPSPLA